MVQVLALAAPGLLITSALTAVMAKYLFTYNWSWVAALLFGAILSATDPVAVAALLKEQGQCQEQVLHRPLGSRQTIGGKYIPISLLGYFLAN